jgi:hypothetical protein
MAHAGGIRGGRNWIEDAVGDKAENRQRGFARREL